MRARPACYIAANFQLHNCYIRASNLSTEPCKGSETAFLSLPLPQWYCYTYAYKTNLLILSRVYITGAPEGHPFVARRPPRRDETKRE